MAVFEDVARYYQGLVESGELKQGDRLPTNDGMAEFHETSLATVSKAMKLLKRNGVVYTTHMGTFVGKRPKDPRNN